MKIGFLIQSLSSGGAERTIAYLANYAVKVGHDADIILYGDRGFYELDEKVNIYTISGNNIDSNIYEKIKIYLKRLINFKKYVKNSKPDVIFCILYPSTIYALPYKRKIPIVVSEVANPMYLKKKSSILIRNLIFKMSSGIIFQTQRAQDYYKDIINNARIVIPNALGNEYIFKVPEINNRANKICAMGRITPEKDYPTLIRAFSIVAKKHPEYILEIFGRGSPEDLLALAEELGIRDKVFFMGAHPDAILKIANSKCYVLSSISEGMPNALMEAMAVGLPCVSTDCPNGPAELIENGVNGLLVPVEDERALAEAILKMIEDEEFAKKCGENAAKIKETHSVETNAKKYLDFFESLVINN